MIASGTGVRSAIAFVAGLGVLAVLAVAVEPGQASTGSAGLAVLLALGAWGLALVGIHVDPLSLRTRYDPRIAEGASLGGLLCGALAMLAFFRTEQRHLSTIPIVWIATATGFGTGIALLWGRAVEWRRRRLDAQLVKEQRQSWQTVRKSVESKIRLGRRRTALLQASQRLDDMMNRAELDPERGDLIANVLHVASEACRGAARCLDRLKNQEVDRVLALAEEARQCANTGGALDVKGFEALRSQVVREGVRILALAGIPNQTAQGAESDAIDEGQQRGWRLDFLPVARNPLHRWLDRLLGLVSVAGPRLGAFYGVAMMFIALLILALFELPSNGIPMSTVARAFGLPIVLFWLGWLWLGIRQPASVPSLVGQLVVSGIAVTIVSGWWLTDVIVWPGMQTPVWVMLLGAMVWALPGFAVGSFRLRRRVHFPPFKTLALAGLPDKAGSSLPGLEDWAADMRGKLTEKAWKEFFDAPFAVWLDKRISPLIERTSSAEVLRIQSIVFAFADASKRDDKRGFIQGANAVSSLEDLARWHFAAQAIIELLDEDNSKGCQADLDKLTEMQVPSLETWIATHDRPEDAATTQDVRDLASRGLFPPRDFRTVGR